MSATSVGRGQQGVAAGWAAAPWAAGWVSQGSRRQRSGGGGCKRVHPGAQLCPDIPPLTKLSSMSQLQAICVAATVTLRGVGWWCCILVIAGSEAVLEAVVDSRNARPCCLARLEAWPRARRVQHCRRRCQAVDLRAEDIQGFWQQANESHAACPAGQRSSQLAAAAPVPNGREGPDQKP